MTALEKSVVHWEENLQRVLEHSLPDCSVRSCALCDEYLYDTRGHCHECPVKLKTGVEHCAETPYYRVLSAARTSFVDWQELEAAVREELEFLRGLADRDEG